MKFKITCNRHLTDSKVKEIRMRGDGIFEARLDCGCWVYFRVDRYEYSGSRLLIGEYVNKLGRVERIKHVDERD